MILPIKVKRQRHNQFQIQDPLCYISARLNYRDENLNSLVWFRNDLRTSDHHALHEACKADKPVIALYVINPMAWRQHDKSANQVSLILKRLHHLKSELMAIGIPLLIETSKNPNPRHIIADTLSRYSVSSLYFNKLYEVDEAKSDSEIENDCRKEDIEIRTFDDRLLAKPVDIKTQAGSPYTVFTPFKKALIKHWMNFGEPKPLSPGRPQKICTLKSSQIPSKVEGFDISIDNQRWPSSTALIEKRLNEFCQQSILHYDSQRNFPAVDGTSALSPYLAIGAISARQCLSHALSVNNGHFTGYNTNVECWISELIWREFYTHILIHFPRVCRGKAFKTNTDTLPWSKDQALLDDWKRGNTGIPLIDAAMRQLIQTGWMHNRLRMVTAMYLTKNCLINWQEGERFFMQHLIDGDFASNNGGWQWAASTGTDAAPYFRIMNPVTQSERFDPEGVFLRRYCPELSHLSRKAIHDPTTHAPHLLKGYPRRKVDLKTSRLHAIETFKNHARNQSC